MTKLNYFKHFYEVKLLFNYGFGFGCRLYPKLLGKQAF